MAAILQRDRGKQAPSAGRAPAAESGLAPTRARWPRGGRIPVGRLASVLIGFLVLFAIVGGLIIFGATRDQRGDSDEFDTSARPGAARAPVSDPRGPWPTWGLNERHDRFIARTEVVPPFDEIWRYSAESTIDSPPVLGPELMYLPAKDGTLHALDRDTGELQWKRQLPGELASSPALTATLVLQASKNGRLYALDPGTGTVQWSFPADGPIESSPVVVDGVALFGTHEGTLYALDIETNRIRWQVERPDAFKGSVAVERNVVIAGNYDGNLYAFGLQDGRELWARQTRRDFAFGGTLFSTPTIAYGRAFVGSTDGRVYAVGRRTGEVLWSTSTDDWVYGSPAVASKRVFVGSYDGRFYAMDAVTGSVEWTFRADDRIAGSATVLGRIVYFSSLGGTTYGLDVRSGRVVWTWRDGRHSPVVADDRRLYLTGSRTQYAFVPERDGVDRPRGITDAAA